MAAFGWHIAFSLILTLAPGEGTTNRLPEDARLADIGREIEFLAAIREREEQADRSEVVPHEQIKGDFKSWISK